VHKAVSSEAIKGQVLQGAKEHVDCAPDININQAWNRADQ